MKKFKQFLKESDEFVVTQEIPNAVVQYVQELIDTVNSVPYLNPQDALDDIEYEFNKFGYTLFLDDVELDPEFGQEEFMIFEANNGDVVKNLMVIFNWNRAESQYKILAELIEMDEVEFDDLITLSQMDESWH